MAPEQRSFVIICSLWTTGTSPSFPLIPLGILCHIVYLKEYTQGSFQKKVCTNINANCRVMAPDLWYFFIYYFLWATGTSPFFPLYPLGIIFHMDFPKMYTWGEFPKKSLQKNLCALQSYGPCSQVIHYTLKSIGHWKFSLLSPSPLGDFMPRKFSARVCLGELPKESLQKQQCKLQSYGT